MLWFPDSATSLRPPPISPGSPFWPRCAYLAEVCEACHIRFIGPDPRVIRLMGDKARARRVMRKAGVPVLPGSEGILESEDHGIGQNPSLGIQKERVAAVAGRELLDVVGRHRVQQSHTVLAGSADAAAAGQIDPRRRLP